MSPGRPPRPTRRCAKRELQGSFALVQALLLMVVLVANAFNSQAQELCAPNKRVAFSLTFSTNRTGHPHFDVNLEQPNELASGRLVIEMGTSTCGSTPQKILKMSLNGDSRQLPPGYVTLPELGHFRRPERALAWLAAREMCASEGAVLLLPATQREMDALYNLYPFNVSGTQNVNYAWVGATDIEQEGKFVSITGLPLDAASSVKHPAGQLSAGINENCLLYHALNKDFHDWPCSNKLAFFCKIAL